MGAVAQKCSNVSLERGTGASKPLDASSSEEEEDEDDEDDAEEGEEDEHEERTEAELALQEGLKRGKTKTFKEVIDHSRVLGIDEDKILKAEAMLEAHKATRRREAFEAEMRDFLDSPESDDLAACEEKERQGLSYGTSEKILAPLKEKMEALKMTRELQIEEIAQAKLLLEVLTRRFVKACLKGRDVTWVDLEKGKKYRASLSLDLTLKNLSVKNAKDGSLMGTCKLVGTFAKRATESDEVTELDVWGQLSELERENAVVTLGDAPTWLFVEPSSAQQDEAIVAMAVLTGAGRGSGGKPKKAGKAAVPSQMPALPTNVVDDEEQAAGPVSPRTSTRRRPNRTPAASEDPGKKAKKDKKEKKEKKKKDEEEEIEGEEEEQADD